VIREIGRVAWYRLRLDLPRRWTSYAGIVLLVALVGGISLGSIAGARRSESAFPTFLKGTNPSDLAIDVGSYNPKILKEIARLPQVTSIETYVSPNAVPVTKAGLVDTHSPLFTSNFDPIASLNGLYFNQDRMTILQGTRPDPRRPDEAMVDEFAAKLYGLHVGSVVRFGFFSNAQLGQNGFPTSPSTRIVSVRITGVGVANTEVVQDEIDTIPSMILTPALTRRLVPCCITYAWSGLTLRHGAADVPAVESGYLHLLPSGYPYYFHVTSVIENEAEQAVKPESIALAVFGLIAGLATVLIAIQLMARLILLTTEEREVMWFVGARPWNTATDSLLGIGISLLLGAAGAAVVAVALSPLLIFGPLQSVVPASGFYVDRTVLGLGALILVVVLGAVAAALNYRGAPGLRAARQANRPLRAPQFTHVASRLDVPAPALLGIRFALERGQGRTSVPVRSSILASTLAIVVVVGTLTFGDSLHTLIGTPRLYGWNWSAMLESDAGYGNVPQTHAAHLLDDDHSVTGWTGIYFDSLLFDGQAVPVVAGDTRAQVAPALLSGHEVDAPDQVVLGAETLSDLHKRVGETVRVSGGARSAVLHIVGIATMPTVGIGFGLHLSIGSGAFVDQSLIPQSVPALLGLSDPGPNAILVRFAPSVSAAAAQRSLVSMVRSLNRLEGGEAGIISFTDIRPAEITDYQAMGVAPLILAVGLATGAVVALTLTLLTSVRRRRRDLALLKALGFTRGQLSAVVAWQSTVSVAIGVLIGVPLGIVFGRAMWDLFAHELFAIPDPTVPLLATGLVALGALLLANLVATIPGWRAANTPTNLILNAE
jgi:ABC-type antimicrobial peptide transport system permease subunit